MRHSRRLQALAYAVAGIAFTVLVVLVILNLLPQEKRLAHDIGRVSAVGSPQFRHELSRLLGPPVVDGNRIVDLQNGEEIFPAMLAAVRNARHSIDFGTYIYWSGPVARRFEDALIDRARAGIEVHVLVDWVGGSRMDEAVVSRFRAAGVRFEYFHPLQWKTLPRLNNRTHRRLLVVDGRIAFTGGVGIAEAWTGDAGRADHWRDMQFQVTGPVVSQFQAVFEDNWITTTGEALLGPRYYPMLTAQGDVAAQMFSSSPEGGNENMQLLYLLAIHGARSSIDLEAGYFVPDSLLLHALKDALSRGVRVRIVLPGKHVESGFVQAASRATWGTLLDAGARLYAYQPSRFHDKLMIVDRYLTVAGSANFDNRSLKLNDEANLNIFDRGFAAHMSTVIDADIAQSRELDAGAWHRRAWWRKLGDGLAALASSQL